MCEKHIDSSWQSIDSCPVDTMVMVWVYDQPAFAKYVLDIDGERCWYEDADYIDDPYYKPTHWRQFPEGPHE
jgi:hypothetical protein